MKIVLPEGIEIRDIFRLAAERDVRIRRLNFRRDTLEDIFLRRWRTRGANGSLSAHLRGVHRSVDSQHGRAGSFFFVMREETSFARKP